MTLLPVVGGALLATTLGCGVNHAYPFRALRTDAGGDSVADLVPDAGSGGGGGGGGSGGSDGGVDVTPVICPVAQVGYSTMGTGGTTGGGLGPTVTVNTLAQFQAQAAVVGPLTIAIHGTIDVGSLTPPQVEIGSDKTVIGAEPGAGLINGGLFIKSQHNVIIHNLTITKPLYPSDGIGIQTSRNIWVDHCDLSSDTTSMKGTYDGLVDVTHASDNVTISWNRFHDHINTSLVGHSQANSVEDTGHLTVTYHHNLFQNTPTGSPRTRFGHVHIFGNYYQGVDTYAIGTESGGTVLVEGNVFDDVAVPIENNVEDRNDAGSPLYGFALDLNNLYLVAGANMIAVTSWNNWKPPYAYTPDSPDIVRAVVPICAGVGKVR